jgi:hypothetical protein
MCRSYAFSGGPAAPSASVSGVDHRHVTGRTRQEDE